MDKQCIILIGRSGSGKGTQASLLKNKLEDIGCVDVTHQTTGGGFRAFIETSSYAASKTKDLTMNGGLSPEFLAIWNWSNLLINVLKRDTSIILDGAPRKFVEVQALHSAIRFFEFNKPIVVYIDVSEGWALDKLKSRGREDDSTVESLTKKMNWFSTDVLPVIDWYSRDERYRYIHVNGEQSVEHVHSEIIQKLQW